MISDKLPINDCVPGTISGTVEKAFEELDGLLSKSALARVYLGKSPSWLLQKLRHSEVHGRERFITIDEATVLADAFRDISFRLNRMADRIDRATGHL